MSSRKAKHGQTSGFNPDASHAILVGILRGARPFSPKWRLPLAVVFEWKPKWPLNETLEPQFELEVDQQLQVSLAPLKAGAYKDGIHSSAHRLYTGLFMDRYFTQSRIGL